jgi:translation elongation factor EF-4
MYCRLALNDSSITVSKDHSSSLGSGLRIGFLGFLHMEVFNQRLADEYTIKVVITTPSVPYKIEYTDGRIMEISSVAQWPDSERNRGFKVFEPIVKVTLMTPTEVI